MPFLLLALIILVNLIHLTYSYTVNVNGFSIFDLESTISNLLLQEANQWTISNKASSNIIITTKASGNMPSKVIFGGQYVLGPSGKATNNQYFQRVYNNLPTHRYVGFTLTMWWFDGYWTTGDPGVKFTLDSVSLNGPRLSYNDDFFQFEGGKDGGSLSWSYDLGFDHIKGGVQHMASTLTFKIISLATKYDSEVQSFGFRDLILYFSDYAGANTAVCHYSEEKSDLAYDQCPCNPNQVKSGSKCVSCATNCDLCLGPAANQCLKCNSNSIWTGSLCQGCHAFCEACYGPTANECTVCKDPYWNYGDGTCADSCLPPYESTQTGTKKYCRNACSAGYYHFFNNTCLKPCNYPLSATVAPQPLVCSIPCTNPSSEFLYWNATCSIACDSPLVPRFEPGVNYCDNPCGLNSPDYLYSNGSCLKTCPPPLIEKIDPGVNYCINPCENSNGYLYPNQSCSDKCSLPLETKQDPSVNYCISPCSSTDYLYDDGSCGSTCKSPLQEKQEDIATFCSQPCGSSGNSFYNAAGTCQSTCDAPNIIQEYSGVKFCSLPLTEEQLDKLAAISKTQDVSSMIANQAKILASIFGPSNPTSIVVAALAKMLQYVRYINMRFPERVQLVLDHQDPNTDGLNFMQGAVKGMKRKFSNHPLPGKFNDYKVPSNFIVNFWQTLLIISIVLILIALFSGLALLFGPSSAIHEYVMKALSVLKWNVFFLIFCGSYNDLVFFSALEFRSLHLDDFASVFSFIVCVLLNGLALVTLYLIVKVNISLRTAKTTELEATKKKYDHLNTFFEIYKDRFFLQQTYLLVYVLRLAVFGAIIVYLFEYPNLQAILISIISGFMILYLLIFRPFKHLVNFLQILSIESILFCFNVCVTCLAAIEGYGVEYESTRNKIGDVMIVLSTIVSVAATVFIVLKILIAIKDAIVSYRTNLKLEKLAKLNPKVQRIITSENQIEPMMKGSPELKHSGIELIQPDTSGFILQNQSSMIHDVSYLNRGSTNYSFDYPQPGPISHMDSSFNQYPQSGPVSHMDSFNHNHHLIEGFDYQSQYSMNSSSIIQNGDGGRSQNKSTFLYTKEARMKRRPQLRRNISNR